MMWVKLTLAPVVRANWLFKTWRFTSNRRAGTLRTLVAVGMERLASMLATMREAAPLRRTASGVAVPLLDAGAAAGVAGRAATAAGAEAAWGAGTGEGR